MTNTDQGRELLEESQMRKQKADQSIAVGPLPNLYLQIVLPNTHGWPIREGAEQGGEQR